jgi:hypothetical protein
MSHHRQSAATPTLLATRHRDSLSMPAERLPLASPAVVRAGNLWENKRHDS